jgi:ribosomal protein L37E
MRIGTHGTMTEKTEKKDIRYCPFCGRTSFELSGEEDDSVYCEHCGVDVKVKELIP